MTEKTYIYESDCVILVPGKVFSEQFLLSWTKTINYFYENNISFIYKFFYFPIVSSVRNYLVGQNPVEPIKSIEGCPVTVFNGEVKTKKVIFIDSDMVWEPEAIEQLLKSPYDITVAPYVLTDKKRSSVRMNDEFLSVEEMGKQTEPFKIHSAGLGFTACNLKVLEAIKYPWFDVKENIVVDENGLQEGFIIGEDVYFFMKAYESGFEIYCDPRIKVGHEKQNIWKI
jgi:hypothetical protein